MQRLEYKQCFTKKGLRHHAQVSLSSLLNGSYFTCFNCAVPILYQSVNW